MLNRTSAWLAVAVVLGTAFGALAGYDLRLAVVAAGVAVLLGLAALPVEATLAAMLAAYAAPLVWIVPSSWDAVRLSAPILLVPLVLRALVDGTPLHLDWVCLGITVLAGVSAASLTWSSATEETAGAAAALVASLALVLLLGSQLDLRRITNFLRMVGAVVVVSSALVAVLPAGTLAGRLRGVFNNPNSLAVILVLLLPFLFVGVWRLAGVPALVLVVMTGSRAAAAACLVVLAVLVAGRGFRSLKRRLLMTGLAVCAIGLALSAVRSAPSYLPAEVPDAVLTRQTDTRTPHWLEGVHQWLSSPLLGHGAGALDVVTANSLLKVLLDLGLVGLIAVLPLLMTLAVTFARGEPRIAAMAAGASVNAFFESWLFTAGSLFFLLFWLVMYVGRREMHDSILGGVPDSTAGAGAGPAQPATATDAGLLPSGSRR